jgi:hypothetical protein
MILKDARENYYTLSAKASDIVRQLGFAGIALIWVFKADQGGKVAIPKSLWPSATFIVVGLTMDLLQYVAGSLLWGIYHRLKEREEISETDQFTAPPWINWPAIFFFWGKITAMAAAYGLLLWYLLSNVS